MRVTLSFSTVFLEINGRHYTAHLLRGMLLVATLTPAAAISWLRRGGWGLGGVLQRYWIYTIIRFLAGFIWQTMQAAVHQGCSILECLCSTVAVGPCSSGTIIMTTNIMSAPEGRLCGKIGRKSITQATSPQLVSSTPSIQALTLLQLYSAARGR